MDLQVGVGYNTIEFLCLSHYWLMHYWALIVIICHMSVTMALTNQIDGWTLRDSAISHVPLCFGPELASPALNQPIRAMWDCKSPPKGWYLQSRMAESFCRFFELKSFLFEFYFFELSLSSIGSMMINTISRGSRGSLAAVVGRDLALPPLQPGEIVYIFPALNKNH